MADKKISELPLLNAVSGSNLLIPLVHDGTTSRIYLSQLGHYASQWSAKTGSANTFTGNQTINGNLVVSGDLKAERYYIETISSSVIYESGSTTWGNSADDTHTFTGSIILNGAAIGGAEINSFTASQLAVNTGISSVTSSLNNFSGSTNQFTRSIELATASLQYFYSFTSSQLDVNTRNSIVTASLNNFTGSTNAFTGALERTTASIHLATASFNYLYQSTASIQAFTASQADRNLVLSTVTGSINQATQSLQSFTSSQADRNLVLSTVTGSLNNFTSSQDSRNFVISQYTSSTDAHIVGISAFTSSQLAVNFGISQITASLIGITNTLMGFTASLDNTYATDAQLYQLYQATRSIELHSGSMIGITNGLMAYTSSNETWKTGVRGEINGVESYTASLKAAAIVSSSTQIQNYDLFALNSNLYIATGSIKGEIAGIESYTASLKAVAIVSSSTQITNYYRFAETASANTFYGNQTFNNDVRANKFVFTDGVINTNVGGQYIIATSGNVTYLYTGTSGLNINDATNGNINVSISNVGAVQTRGKLTVGSPGNDQDIAFGGSNAKLDWAGTGAQIGYSVGALQFSSVGTTNNMILQQQAGALFNAGITGSLMATNNVVSSSTQIVNYNLFALTASANTFWGTQTFSGSLNLSGSMEQTGLSTLIGNTVLSGSIAMSGSTTQVGNNTIVGNTVMSGSIEVSGSSNFKNSEFRVTGSSFFTGSHTITGNSIFSGSINIASGSSYYRAGNKLFNYGQWGCVQTQSGSINTAYPIKLETKFDGSEGISVANNGSGFPTRITAENTGLYNIQFSLQLNTTATETCDFSVWFAMTGSNIANSNTDFSIDKTAGGGNGVAALNLLTPITAGDYVELYWSNSTGNGQLLYKAPQSTPTRPATPSAIVTITQVA